MTQITTMTPDVLQAIEHVGRLGRRDFLKFSAAAAGLAAAGGLFAPLASAVDLPPGIRHLSGPEYAVFHRLMEVALPTRGTALVPTARIPVLQTLDGALLATMEAHILKGLKGGIAYFNEGPTAMFGKPFVALSDIEARAFCDIWADSDELPQRALVVGLKKLVGLAYWANPPTWAPLGYDGPVTDKWNLKSLGNAPMPTA